MVQKSEADLQRLLVAICDLSASRTLDDVMGVVRIAARELAQADGVTFVLRDGDQCYYAEENAIAPLWKGLRFPMSICISGWCMLNAQEVAITDIYADPRIPADAYRPTFVKSLAMVPVRRQDPVAAIGAYWAETHEPTDHDLSLLQSLADGTALALENVELYQDLRRQADENAELYQRAEAEIAKRERLEDELRQAQKMEAVGRLAGGVAHDFNNLLTIISGFAEMAQLSAADDPVVTGHIEQIIQATQGASSLTSQLLAFSRRQVLQPKVIDLNGVVSRVSSMLQRLIGEDIHLATILQDDLHPIYFDPGHIEQIMLNLAVNARDAMPHGGRLTIETKNVSLDDDYVAAHPDAQVGAHAMIAVSDTGSGMDADTRARIFEPFFTTKDRSKGTGLGLSTVYGIVKQSGGNIWVYSELGRGTTFKVYLPKATVSDAPDPKPRPPTEPANGSETLLLVEDNQGVRELFSTVLRAAGYTVIAAADATTAMQLIRQHPEPIDMLLTDVVMPDISGPELAEHITRRYPAAKVVYMSGYTDDAIVHHGVLSPDTAYIEKPISPRELVRRVHAYLNARD